MSAGTRPDRPDRAERARQRAVLRGVRRQARGASGGSSLSERALAVYTAVLVALFAGVPLLWGLFGLALQAGAVEAVRAAAPRLAAAGWFGAWSLSLFAGGVCGPLRAGSFLARTLADSPLSRRLVLLRPWSLALAAGAVAGAGAGALCAVSAGVADPADPFFARWLLVSIACGLIAALAWCGGQLLSATRRRATVLLCAIGAGATGAGLLPPLAFAWTSESSAPAAQAAGAGAFWLCPAVLSWCSFRALDRLPGERFVAHSLRWSQVRTLVQAGELAAISGQAPPPHALRAVSAVRRGPFPWTVLVRDAIGSARTPWRLGSGCAGLVAGGALLGLGAGIGSGLGPVLLAAGGLLCAAGLGPCTDGMRFAAGANAGPAFLGGSRTRLFALHCLWPLAAGSLLSLPALWGAAAAAGAEAVTGLLASIAAAGTVPLRLAAARGPMPIALLSPVSTAMGDASAVVVLLWQLEPAILAALLPIVLAGGSSEPLPVALRLLAVAAGLGWLLSRRLR